MVNVCMRDRHGYCEKCDSYQYNNPNCIELESDLSMFDDDGDFDYDRADYED